MDENNRSLLRRMKKVYQKKMMVPIILLDHFLSELY